MLIQQKQVEKAHYRFDSYLHRWRWRSLWHQLHEVLTLKPERALEIGPGPGIFKNMCNAFDLKIETLDLDPELKPDHVGSATALPFNKSTFDVVCAFQVLEHMPYNTALAALDEMLRISKDFVIISLPDAKPLWQIYIELPGCNPLTIKIPRPPLRLQKHRFDGEHYWEINKAETPLGIVIKDISAKAEICKTYNTPGYYYHRFFVLRKKQQTN